MWCRRRESNDTPPLILRNLLKTYERKNRTNLCMPASYVQNHVQQFEGRVSIRPLNAGLRSSPSRIQETIRELPDDEARARGLEAVADTDAYTSIAYVYCGLCRCNSRPPNHADLDKGRRLWAIAISKWKLAMNTTHDDKLRDRLLEKTRPAHGVSCDEKTCEPNFTHDNRSAGISIPATQFDAQ